MCLQALPLRIALRRARAAWSASALAISLELKTPSSPLFFATVCTTRAPDALLDAFALLYVVVSEVAGGGNAAVDTNCLLRRVIGLAFVPALALCSSVRRQAEACNHCRPLRPRRAAYR